MLPRCRPAGEPFVIPTFDVQVRDVEGFMDELQEFQSVVHDCFARSEARGHGWDYMVGQSIGFPKMFRALLCRHGAERFTVSRHENRDLTGSMGKMQQRAVDLRLQVDELWKVLQMRGFLLDLLPQVFDRVELR